MLSNDIREKWFNYFSQFNDEGIATFLKDFSLVWGSHPRVKEVIRIGESVIAERASRFYSGAYLLN